MDTVDSLVRELQKHPARFRSRGGFERLLDQLTLSHVVEPLQACLNERPEFAGDLLWTIAEMETVERFVPSALLYLADDDPGTAAYAVEIVLRGSGSEPAALRLAFEKLREANVAVCEHAVRTLVAAGSDHLKSVLYAVGHPWCVSIAESLGGRVGKADMEALIQHHARDRQVVGTVLASLAWETDVEYKSSFASASEPWIREYGVWLADGR